MKKEEIIRDFENLYFDVESLLPLIGHFMTDRWSELEEAPEDESILKKMQDTKNALVDALFAQTDMSDREIADILSGMQTSHASEKKTLNNWRTLGNPE